MKLVSFSYNDQYWQLDDLNLQTVNLIVGRNASGKSKTIEKINLFNRILSYKETLIEDGNWKAIFLTESGERIQYSFTSEVFIIRQESLSIDDRVVIERAINDKGILCRVWSETRQGFEDFSPPHDQLVVHIRRDTRDYPLFEKLINWTSNTNYFKFGEVVPSMNANRENSYFSSLSVSKSGVRETLGEVINALSIEYKNEILNLMSQFGYKITSVDVIDTGFSTYLSIREDGVLNNYSDHNLSQGTYRILLLLAYLQYLIYVKKPQLIAIDDLGEGLDYQRSTQLGKYVFDTCKSTDIQLIATSNDGFIMDAVPIKYWNILVREGAKVKALNKKNSPNLFNDFVFSGLSNFDFFSSDYIESHSK